MPSITDVPSIEEVAALDRAALFAEFSPLMQRLIRRYGEAGSLGEDLVGEIYCRFCALLDLYDPERGVPLRPYLVRQLSAAIYTYARHAWRQGRRETSLETHFEAAQSQVPNNPTPDWDDRLVQRQLLDRLAGCLPLLPPRQRRVIIWRYYDDWSFEQIAAELQVKAATARSLLRHGMNTLRRHLERAGVSSLA